MSAELRQVSGDIFQTHVSVSLLVSWSVVTILTNTPLKRWQVRSPTSPQHSINAIKLEGEFVLMQALLIRQISPEKMSVSNTLRTVRTPLRLLRF